ncbi:hypothetical protein C2845_PM13G06030 [Panicum miliaceum]|uniref:Uncharacterized protein n=1 Tax=Panicum miliaceum TaxID=4540 RepID=A0A3L6RHB8_PANMI|nr:hypothetical protein C2845_PM13G06030 [Panicum miliaceum]
MAGWEMGAGAEAPELQQQLPAELVSAVDVYHRGAPLLSRVVETPASSSWFLTSSFRVDVVECGSPAPAGRGLGRGMSPAELELSWVVVDPRAWEGVVGVQGLRRPPQLLPVRCLLVAHRLLSSSSRSLPSSKKRSQRRRPKSGELAARNSNPPRPEHLHLLLDLHRMS